jgi:putative membrane protein
MNNQRPEGKKSNNLNEHLANERTFLAWIRTGIATIILGFVIARFSFWLREISISTGQKLNIPQTGLSLPIGLGMVAFGALMTLLAALRFHDMHKAIEEDVARPRPGLIILTTAAVILLAVILIVYLLVASQQL